MLENYLSNPICWPQQHLNVLEIYQKTELSHVHCAVPQNALTVISLYVSNAVVEDTLTVGLRYQFSPAVTTSISPPMMLPSLRYKFEYRSINSQAPNPPLVMEKFRFGLMRS